MAQDLLQGDGVGIVTSKIETTYGTDPSPTTTSDATVVTKAELAPMQDFQPIERVGPAWQSMGDAPGSRKSKYSTVCPFIGGGDPGVGDLDPPSWAPELQAAGFALASTDEGSGNIDTHTFTPSTTQAQVSLTRYLYILQDGHANAELFRANGCVHNAKLNFSAGKPALMTFDGMGLFVAPSTVSKPSTPVYTHPDESMICRNATLTIGGTSFIISEIEIDMGMTVVERPSIGTGVDGFAGFYLKRDKGKSISGSFTVEAQPTSSYDRWAAVNAGGTATFNLVLDGPKGDRVTVTGEIQLLSPDIQLDTPVKYKQPFNFIQQSDAGDDALTIIVTRTP